MQALGGAALTGAALAGSALGMAGGEVSAGTIELTFPSAVLFPIDDFHTRRGLLGSNASRSYFSFAQDGTTFGVDTSHEGSGADCTLWNASLSGATRVNVALSAGARTGTEWATAVETALGLAGVTGVSRVGDTLTIEDVSGLSIGPAMTYDTSIRGVWGMQRRSYGPGFDLSLGDMGGTGSVHVTAPATAGRIIGVFMRAGGSANVRLGIANGPAYSTTPAAFSAGVEGASTRGSVDTDLCLLTLSEPMAYTAAQDKWVSFRGVAGGNPQLRYRAHGSSPEGRGDIVSGEQLLFSTTTSNPATAIYTAGAYTHGDEAGPYGIYAFVGFVYEQPTAGEYPGRGDIVTQVGSHATATAGTPTATIAADMDGEVFVMRYAIPWAGQITSCTVSVAGRAADEDMGHAVYEFFDTDAPASSTPELLRDAGAFGMTGTGYQTHVYATPIDVTAGQIVGFTFNAGNVDGSTPTDTVSVNYDPNTAGQDAWLTSWVDDGRTWNDLCQDGGGGFGNVTEYRSQLALGSTMPMGDPNAAWPSTYLTDAFDDHSTENLLRFRFGLVRAGITGQQS